MYDRSLGADDVFTFIFLFFMTIHIESDPIFFLLVGRTSHQYKVGGANMQEILQKSSKNSFFEIKV